MMSAPSKKSVQVYQKTGGRCWYCGCNVDPYAGQVTAKLFVVEHQTPLSRGGTHDIGNLVPACLSCNSQKGDKTLEEYRSYMAFYMIGVKQFSADQLDYLESLGVTISPYPIRIVFWGEEGES